MELLDLPMNTTVIFELAKVRSVSHLAASAEMSSGLSLEAVRRRGRFAVRAFGTHSMTACKSCCHADGNLN